LGGGILKDGYDDSIIDLFLDELQLPALDDEVD
jgi:hypothetical protein